MTAPRDPTMWRKSSRSQQVTNCVEVAFVSPAVAVRDSKNPNGGALRFSTSPWAQFQEGIKAGHFDLA